MSASEAVIAIAGTGTALLNLVAAWKSSGQKDKTQAAVLKSSHEVNQTLESLEASIASLATGIDHRFGDSQAQTTQVLEMYRELANRPPSGSQA